MKKVILMIIMITGLIIGFRFEIFKGGESPGEIEAFFNKKIERKYGSGGGDNLEKEIIEFIDEAERKIDLCVYEINLPHIVEKLMDRAEDGISVRIIVDGKEEGEDGYREKRYLLMRLYIEKMIRGHDGELGTGDDIAVFADSPIFAVEDAEVREHFCLPERPEGLKKEKILVGKKAREGYVIAYGEYKEDGSYVSPQNQMHNKFMVIDSKKLWTGSWNMTVSGLYGGYEEAKKEKLNGNQQHCVLVFNEEVAKIYEEHFNEMWGGEGFYPDYKRANFGRRKNTRNSFKIEGEGVHYEIYFSPNHNVIDRIKEIVSSRDKSRIAMALFCISHTPLMEEIIKKGREDDVTMVIDEGMWKQRWSSVRKLCTSEEFFPIYEDALDGKLHAKSAVLDPFQEDSVVITGSMNWTKNGQENNDENVIIIFGDGRIAKEFYGEIISRANESIR